MIKEHETILKKATILLVEDNVELRTKFKNILDTYVLKVYEASTGEEAIELFNKINPNIIISDFRMSAMNGLELTLEIRKINKYIPIVIISAYTDKSSLIEFTSLNLIQYIMKPINYEQLNNILQKCAEELIEKGLIEVRLHENTIYSYSQKCIIKNDKYLTLSPNEIKFLELLINNQRKLVSIDMIEYYVYNNEFVSDAALNNLVSKLRKKIGFNIIKTIPKTGYLITI